MFTNYKIKNIKKKNASLKKALTEREKELSKYKSEQKMLNVSLEETMRLKQIIDHKILNVKDVQKQCDILLNDIKLLRKEMIKIGERGEDHI